MIYDVVKWLKIFVDSFSKSRVAQRCFVKKVFLEILQASACNFIKKEALAQVFSCEFCEASNNTFFYRTPPVVGSVSPLSFDLFIWLFFSSVHILYSQTN